MTKQNSQEVRVYVGTYTSGESEGIYLYRMAASGALEFVSVAEWVNNPSFLAIDPKQRYLYAVSEVGQFADKPGGAVCAFSIDPETGELTSLNQQASHGTSPCYLSVDRTGKCVLVANYGSGSVAVLPIGSNGELGEATDVVQHSGSSVNPQRQEGPHAHSIVLDNSGRYAFVPQHPGTFHLRLGVTRLDGTTEPTWEGAMLVFHVVPANTWPPQLVGLTDLRLAEGETARVGLQALDLEGGTVSFEVVDDGGIGATVDEESGLLTLRPGEGDDGVHQVVVRLSDGELSEDVTISLVVEPKEASAAPFATLVIVVVVALVLLLWWRRRTAPAKEWDPNGNESGSG